MRLISPREYAKKLGYKSLSTVYNKMRSGQIPYVDEPYTRKRIPFDDKENKAVISQ